MQAIVVSTEEALRQAREALARQQHASNQPTNGEAGPPPLSTADRHEFQQLVDLVAKSGKSGKGASSAAAAAVESEEAFKRVLPHIKSFIRQGDAYAALGAELLLEKLYDPLPSVRISLMRVVDCLFMRSKAFRASVLQQFHALLALTVGIGPNASRVAPRPERGREKELQTMSIVCVRTWADTYGDAIKLLRVAHDYMQSRVGRLHVPTRREVEQAAASSRALRRERTQQLLAARFARLVTDFDSGMSELEGVLNEIANSIELLFPQANQAAFDAFLLSDETEQQEEPPAKRLKADAAAAHSSDPGLAVAAVLSHATAAAVSAVPSVASSAAAAVIEPSGLLPPPAIGAGVDDSIEWEDVCAVAEPLPATPTPCPPPLSSSQPLASLLPASAPRSVDPAAAAFLENEAADPHWWLYEEPSDESGEAMPEEEGGLPSDEDAELGQADPDESEQPGGTEEQEQEQEPHLALGLGDRGYSLQIEFAANFAAVENDDNRVVLESLREAWQRIQRSLLPLLNEWIDVLTRVEFPEEAPAPVAAAAATTTVAVAAAAAAVTPAPTPSSSTSSSFSSFSSSLAAPLPAHLRAAARDRYLLLSVEKRELLQTLRTKCAKLGLPVSQTAAADRSALMRSATERAIVDQPVGAGAGAGAGRPAAAAASPSPSPSPSPSAAASTEAAVLAHTRHATRLAAQRSRAAALATKKIREVKRRYAKQLEQDRLERRNNPAAAAAHATALSMRRPFSGPSIAAATPSPLLKQETL